MTEQTKTTILTNKGDDGWREDAIDHTAAPKLNGSENVLREIVNMRKPDFKLPTNQFTGRLMEALISNPDAANMLRDEIRRIAFQGYSEQRTFYEMVTRRVDSNNQSEYYIRDGLFGTFNEVPSGEEVPAMQRAFEGSAHIVNKRYAQMVSVTGDDIRFDRMNLIRQIPAMMGAAARSTIDAKVFEVITDTSNYTSTSPADNDVGSNTSSLVASFENINTARSTINTVRDRTSGQPGMCNADTFICTPRLEMWIRKALDSTETRPVGGNTAIPFGEGTDNPFNGMLRVIVTPLLGKEYEWALFDSTKWGLVYQELEPFNVYQQTMMPNNHAWFTFDRINYMGSMYFGVGFVDDRVWYYSNSTTAPA